MRRWDLTTPAARLKQTLKDLQVARVEVAASWDDQTSREFQETYLDPIRPRIQRTITAITDLAEVLARAERECGWDDYGSV